MENKNKKAKKPYKKEEKNTNFKLSLDERRDLERIDLNAGTLEAPLPAVMVSCGDMENSNIITIAWTGILSTNPPRAYISVRPQRFSHKMIEESGEFVINLTTEELVYETDFVGVYTGDKVNKFEKLGLKKIKSKAVSCPTIAESPLSLECRVFDKMSSGTHDVYFADILNVSVRGDIIGDDGKIRLNRAHLIAYAHGEYFSLGKKVGEFGFSAAKKGNPKAKYLRNCRTVSKNK